MIMQHPQACRQKLWRNRWSGGIHTLSEALAESMILMHTQAQSQKLWQNRWSGGKLWRNQWLTEAMAESMMHHWFELVASGLKGSNHLESSTEVRGLEKVPGWRSWVQHFIGIVPNG
jgi:hypothetical protein